MHAFRHALFLHYQERGHIGHLWAGSGIACNFLLGIWYRGLEALLVKNSLYEYTPTNKLLHTRNSSI